jgi:Cof subfamily protein (haloacid dehalogenase superfamily)
MDVRLIAVDLDGTLLAGDGKIPDINARALLECQKRGIRVLFSSGRSFESISHLARGAGLDPMISSVNGARIDLSTAGETVAESTMDEQTSLRVYEALKNAGIYFMAFTRGHSYMANLAARTGTHIHQPGVYFYGGHPYEMVADPARVCAEGTVHPYKYVAFARDYDPKFDGIREKLSDFNLSISSSWRDNLEIMRPGVDKGASLKFVAERFGIPREAVMAFGDNTNDVPMFEYAGHPVAMENAEACARRAARYVASDCDAGGVGKLIEELVLS